MYSCYCYIVRREETRHPENTDGLHNVELANSTRSSSSKKMESRNEREQLLSTPADNADEEDSHVIPLQTNQVCVSMCMCVCVYV